MSDPFFMPAAGAKRRRPGVTRTAAKLAGLGKDKAAGAGRGKPAKDKKAAGGDAKGAKRSKATRDEEDDEEDDDDVGYTGLDDDDDEDAAGSEEESSDEEDEELKETPAEKRVRLAKQYLEALARPAAADEDEAAGSDLEEGDRDRIAARLLQDNLAGTSRLQVHIADQLPEAIGWEGVVSHKCHDLPVTCVALSDDERFVFSSGKEGTIIKWNIATRTRAWTVRAKVKDAPASFQGHTHQVLALAVTSDGQFLASGGRDMTIRIWDANTGAHVHCFRQHRGVITGLAFRRGTYQLFSASEDRTIKVWEVAEKAYVETLFGHQEGVLSVDALSRERCLTCGGRDRTARLWKIPEESHLVFRGHNTSMDVVRWLSDDSFVSGDDAGNLSLWDVNKKKPVVTIAAAHGTGRWISALATVPHSDLVASGASDGVVRFWKVGDSRRSLTQVASLAMPGFINWLAFSNSGRLLAIGVGQEHRLGRWERQTAARNAVHVVPLPLDRDQASRVAVQKLKAAAAPPVFAPPARPAAVEANGAAETKPKETKKLTKDPKNTVLGKRPAGRGPKARAALAGRR